jgi:hypothetical protein
MMPGEMPGMPPRIMPGGEGFANPALRANPNAGNPEAPAQPSPGPDASGVATTNVYVLTCRAVNLSSIDPSANSEMAYAVENEIKASPMVDPKATQLTGQITPDDSNGTFTFTVNVVPLNPLKF